MAPGQPIIDLGHFIEATRDSGYKSTTSAIAELVDNSLQPTHQRSPLMFGRLVTRRHRSR